jgi:hypothetical protein
MAVMAVIFIFKKIKPFSKVSGQSKKEFMGWMGTVVARY